MSRKTFIFYNLSEKKIRSAEGDHDRVDGYIIELIWIKGPQLTDRDYLKDTNKVGYFSRINPGNENRPIFLVRLRRNNQSNPWILYFFYSHDLSVKGT